MQCRCVEWLGHSRRAGVVLPAPPSLPHFAFPMLILPHVWGKCKPLLEDLAKNAPALGRQVNMVKKERQL